MSNAIEVFNIIFAVIFSLEAFLKLSAFGMYYFQDNWNKFDFIIVILSLLGLAIGTIFPTLNVGSSANLVRSFRVLRVLRLIQRA